MRLAIVGGGPGGLMTAYLLRKRITQPLEITIFEASDRLGGKVLAGRFDSIPVRYEAGAAELYDYSPLGPDPLRQLVDELGLTTQPMDGRTVVMNGTFLKSDDDIRLFFGEKTVRALDDFRKRAVEAITPEDYYESDWKADNKDPLSRKKFDELLNGVPDEAARKYIRVAVHSDLATEPHLTSAMYGLQNYLMNEPGYLPLYTITGGIESLTRELAARVEERVLLEHRVTAVERTDSGYAVETRHGRETFDGVIVALPNNWITGIEWRGERLAAVMHAHHRHYDYPAHYLRVSILFQRPFWREEVNESYFMLDAFGGCCVYDETSRCDGGACGVLGWLLAGDAAMNFSNLGDSELIEEVLSSLPGCWPEARELFVEGKVHRWIGSVNGMPAGYPAREPDSRHTPDPDGHPELFVVGDYLFDSTLNGVLDSADVVAELVSELPQLEPAAGELHLQWN